MSFDSGTIEGRFILDDTPFQTTLKKVEKSTKKSTSGVAKSFKTATKAVAGLAAGYASLSAVNTAKNSFKEFQKQLNNVSTVSTLTGKELENFGKKFLELPSKLGDTSELVAGAYQAFSAGAANASDAFDVVATSAKFARGQVTNTAAAVDIITTATNAYAASNLAAGRAGDIFAAVIAKGKITGDQLSQSIGKSISAAASASVSLEELGASVATLTSIGVKPAEAMTKFNAIIREVSKPTAALKAEIEKLGYASGGALLQSEGLEGALRLLSEATGGQTDKLYDFLSSSEAVNGAMGLMTNNLDIYKAKLSDVTNSQGANDLAFDKAAKGIEYTKEAFNKIGITIGSIIYPAFITIGDAVERFNNILQGSDSGFNGFVARVQTIAPYLTIAATALASFSAVVFLSNGGLGATVKTLAVWGKAIKGSIILTKAQTAAELVKQAVQKADPIYLIASVLAAVIASTIVLYKTNEKFRLGANLAWAAVLYGAAQALKFGMVPVTNILGTIIAGYIKLAKLVGLPVAGAENLADKLQRAGDFSKNLAETAKKGFAEARYAYNNYDPTKDRVAGQVGLQDGIQKTKEKREADAAAAAAAAEQERTDRLKVTQLTAEQLAQMEQVRRSRELELVGLTEQETKIKNLEFALSDAKEAYLATGQGKDKVAAITEQLKEAKKGTKELTTGTLSFKDQVTQAFSEGANGVQKFGNAAKVVVGEVKKHYSAGAGAVSNVLNNIGSAAKGFSDARLAEIELDRQKQLNSITDVYAAKRADIEQNIVDEAEKKEALAALEREEAAKKEAVEAVFKKKKNAEQRKAFETEKALKISQALINIPLAAINAFLSVASIPIVGPILGAAAAAAAVAFGGIQVGLIASQKFVPQAAEGGEVVKSGLVQINEQGGELRKLPKGETIIPHDLSKQYLENSAVDRGTQFVNNFYITASENQEEIAQFVLNKLSQQFGRA